MKKLLIWIFVAMSASAQSQMSKENYVILYTGDTFTGNHVLYDSPILRSPSFQMDDKRFETGKVAFVQNNNGYFANLDHLYRGKERYAMRIRTGRICVYEEVDMSLYGGEQLQLSSDTPNELEKTDRLASGNSFGYYNVMGREIQRATYRNLKFDLADNPEAMKEVRMIRKYQILQCLLFAGGAGLIANAVVQQSGGAVRFNPMMGLGIVLSASPVFLEGKKDNARWLAVDAYNR
jgi:hypothetical protein